MSNARRIRVRMHNPVPSGWHGEGLSRSGLSRVKPSRKIPGWGGPAGRARARFAIEAAVRAGKPTPRAAIAALGPHDAAAYRAQIGGAKKKTTPRKARATKKKSKPRARAQKGVTVMAKKSKKGRKGRKKARSAKQRAATARMLAANRRARHGSGKKRSKGKRKKNPGRKRPPSGAHPVKASRRTKNKARRKTKWHRTRGGYFRRTNPSSPILQVLMGGLIGVAVPVTATALARRFFPEHARMIGAGAGLVAAGVGVSQAKKRPVLAASLVTGSVAATAAPMLTAAAEKAIAPANSDAKVLADARLEGVRMLEGLTMRHPALSGLRNTLGGVRRNLGGLAAA